MTTELFTIAPLEWEWSGEYGGIWTASGCGSYYSIRKVGEKWILYIGSHWLDNPNTPCASPEEGKALAATHWEEYMKQGLIPAPDLRTCPVCLNGHHGYDAEGYVIGCPNGVVLDAATPAADSIRRAAEDRPISSWDMMTEFAEAKTHERLADLVWAFRAMVEDDDDAPFFTPEAIAKSTVYGEVLGLYFEHAKRVLGRSPLPIEVDQIEVGFCNPNGAEIKACGLERGRRVLVELMSRQCAGKTGETPTQ